MAAIPRGADGGAAGAAGAAMAAAARQGARPIRAPARVHPARPAVPLHKIGHPIHGREIARGLRRQSGIGTPHRANPGDAEIAGGIEHAQ